MPEARKSFLKKTFHALSRKKKWLRSKKDHSGTKVLGGTKVTARSISSTNPKQNKLSHTRPIRGGPSFSELDETRSLSSFLNERQCTNLTDLPLNENDSCDESSLYSDKQSCSSFNHNSSLDEEAAAGEYEFAISSAHSSQAAAENEENGHSTVASAIRDWALNEANVPEATVTRLLKQMKSFYPELPQTFETVLLQPKLSYQDMSGGLYVHFQNWKKSLANVLEQNYTTSSGKIPYTLLINRDGLLLLKHSPD